MGENNSVLNSELAVQILNTIASSTDCNYPTKLAEELGRSQPSISRLLADLHRLGFIRKGERKKTQYYMVDYEGMSEYWYSQIVNKVKQEEDEETLRQLEESSEEAKQLAARFFEECLSSHEISGMTVSRLIFDGFAYSAGYSTMENKEVMKQNQSLKAAMKGLKLYTQEKEFCSEICDAMEKSIEETL